MDSATWCRTPAAASAVRRLRPEVSKNSSTALSSNEGELVRSITTCAPAMASLRPSPVMLLTPVLGEAATTSWPPWRRMGTAFEPMRPVPPITTIFMVDPPLSMRKGMSNAIVPQARWECTPWAGGGGGGGGSGGVTPKRAFGGIMVLCRPPYAGAPSPRGFLALHTSLTKPPDTVGESPSRFYKYFFLR